jgi:hypothetical protein
MGAPVDVARDLAENPKSDTDPEAAGPIWVKCSNGTEQVFQPGNTLLGRFRGLTELRSIIAALGSIPK